MIQDVAARLHNKNNINSAASVEINAQCSSLMNTGWTARQAVLWSEDAGVCLSSSMTAHIPGWPPAAALDSAGSQEYEGKRVFSLRRV